MISTTTSLQRQINAVGVSFEMAIKQAFTDAFILFAVLVQPMLIAILALWMLKGQNQSNAIFAVVGSAMTGLWSSLLFISGNAVTGERWMGTLEALVGMPTHISVIVLGKNLAYVTQSLLSMVVSYALAALFFGYPLRVEEPLLFAVSLVFTVVSFVSFGLLIAPIFIINPAVQALQNGLEYPVYILSGFLFPIALLPGWTTPITFLLAPYWAARALHLASEGGAAGEIALCWGFMSALSVMYLGVSRGLFRFMLRKARIDATLGMQ